MTKRTQLGWPKGLDPIDQIDSTQWPKGLNPTDQKDLIQQQKQLT